MTTAAKKDMDGAGDMGTMSGSADTKSGRIPHGAQVLADMHACLKMMDSIATDNADVFDNDHVKKCVETMAPHRKRLGSHLAKAFAKAYPELEPLEEEEEHEEEAGAAGRQDQTTEKPEKPHETKGLSEVEQNALQPHRKAVQRKGEATPAASPAAATTAGELDAESVAFFRKQLTIAQQHAEENRKLLAEVIG